MEQELIRLKIISTEMNTPLTALFITDVMKSFGFPKKRAVLLCFTVESFLESRLRQLSSENPFVEVIVSQGIRKISISIGDKGVPYVLTDAQRRMLSRGLADSYRFEQLGCEGQRLVLGFRRETDSDIPLPTPEEETLLDENISVVPMGTEDWEINEAIRCFYSAYGYEYLHQSLYNIDHFKTMLKDGSCIAALAKNEHGQVLGISSLMRDGDFPGLYEISATVTKPFARNHHVAQKINNYLLEQMEKIDAECLYTCPVAFHTATQKIFNSCGMTPFGFIFHGFPAKSVGAFRDGDRRPDYAISAVVKDKTKLRRFCLPEQLHGFIAQRMEMEGLRYTFLPEDGALSAESEIIMDIDAYTAITTFIVNACAADFDEKFTEMFRSRAVQQTEMVLLFLNAGRKGAEEACRSLKELGFLFTGLIPGSTNGEYVIFQHMMGMPIQRERIELIDNYADLVDQILALNAPPEGC